MKKIDVLGIKINPLTVAELHAELALAVAQEEKALVLHVNVHSMNVAWSQEWLRQFLNSAAIVFCDGAGVILGARILGERIPERITYADWLWQLAGFCESEGLSLFFLGARPGVAETAASNLREEYPRLRIAGTHHGYFEKRGDQNKRVIEIINQSCPNILVVGFGTPLQERWLRDHWLELDVNVFLTGGACFDFVSGRLPRGPRWMLDHGLEWLFRLLTEPRRLWRRYLIGNIIFMSRVFNARIRQLFSER